MENPPGRDLHNNLINWRRRLYSLLCPECQKPFASQETLKRHLLDQHHDPADLTAKTRIAVALRAAQANTNKATVPNSKRPVVPEASPRDADDSDNGSASPNKRIKSPGPESPMERSPPPVTRNRGRPPPASTGKFASAEDLSPLRSPPPVTRSRGRPPPASGKVPSAEDFPSRRDTKGRGVYSPDEHAFEAPIGGTSQQSRPFPAALRLIREPETRPVSQEQLVAEVKSIYAGLDMVENKCLEIDRRKDSINQSARTANMDGMSQSPPRTLPAERIVQWLPGTLNGSKVEANPDKGSSCNLISERFAQSLDLKPEPGTGTIVRMPTGGKCSSLGTVKAQFRLGLGKTSPSEILCHVVRGCVHPLVLGSSFLHTEGIFSKLKHLVKKIRVPLSKKFSLHFVDDKSDGLQFIHGYMNGTPILALPDSGSDILVMSGSMARSMGLTVDSSRENRSVVSFIDGSEVMTAGIVRGVDWRFDPGEAPVMCDFHVMEDLEVDVILSSLMLDEMDVFSRFEDQFTLQGAPAVSGYDSVYCLRLVEEYEKTRSRHATEVDLDLASEQPFSPNMIQRELARRDEMRILISKLPKGSREPAHRKERDRQSKWHYEFKRHTREPRAAAAHGGGQTPRDNHASAGNQTSGEPLYRPPMETFQVDLEAGLSHTSRGWGLSWFRRSS